MTSLLNAPLGNGTTLSSFSRWREVMEPTWARARDLLGGTEAMRAAKTRYLPKFEMESDASYMRRIQLGTLNNFYRRMAQTMLGYLFAEPVAVEESDLPDEFLADVDRRNRNINQFARQLAWQGLTRGLMLIHTDYPVIPSGLTLAQERERGARPYWVHIVPDNLIAGFSYENAGEERIAHLRWYENRVEPTADQWGEQMVQRIRVVDKLGIGREATVLAAQLKKLDIGADAYMAADVVFSVWRNVGNLQGFNNTWELEQAGIIDATDFPIEVGYSERLSFMTSHPPLDDVSWKNIQHWRKSIDLDHILELSAYPTQFQIGTDEPVDLTGPSVVLHSENAEARFGYIEPTGTGVGANERALDRIVTEAEMLGFQLLKPTGQSPTATGRVLDETKSTSRLHDLALELEDVLNRGLQHAGQWYGLSPDRVGYAKVNKDFGVDPEVIKRLEQLHKMRVSGDLSLRTYLERARDLRLLPRELDIEAEVTAVEEEILAGQRAMPDGLADMRADPQAMQDVNSQ